MTESSVAIRSIHARWVATAEPDVAPVLENHVITMEGQKITSIVPRESFDGTPDLHLPTHIVIPGLVNCHTHTSMTLLRGVADDINLQPWLFENMFPIEGNFVMNAAPEDAREFIRLGSELAVYEMLKTGTTLFNDMYFHGDITADVVRRAGLRAVLAPMGLLYFGDDEKFASNVKLNTDWLTKFDSDMEDDGDDRIYPSLIPHSAYMVPESKLKEAKEAYEKVSPGKKFVIHSHLHETKKEVDDVMEKTGTSAVKIFERLGMLSGMVCAHGVHLTDEEIQVLASCGANVAHCPRSNLKLGSGIPPVVKMLDAGVNVCIGTDGPASNNTLDLLTEIQYASFLAKGSSGDPTKVPALQALQMGTICGAKALGLAEKTGSIKVGKAADLVAFDLGHIEVAPIYDPLGALIFTNRRDVTHVWVNGRCLVKDGSVLTLSLDMEKLETLLAKIRDFRTTLPCGKNSVGSIHVNLCK